jgi:hypothetical protein
VTDMKLQDDIAAARKEIEQQKQKAANP